MRKFLELGLLLLPLMLNAQTGNQILMKVEDTMNAPKDRVATMKLILIEKNGDSKEREIKSWQLGNEKRLIKFLSPADVKGVGFLVLSDNEMYLWMPAFHKIRRIASHVRNQSFMGTDFSYDDIGKMEYSKDYRAEIEDETEEEYVLELIPNSESDVEYLKLVMRVDKTNYLSSKIEYYGKNENVLKVMTTERAEKIGDYWNPQKIVMKNMKTGHKTVMEMEEVVFDTGLKQSIFTKRNLKRAE